MENEIERRPDRMSGEIGELAAALAEAQGEFESVHADRTGQTGHRAYKYADLAAVLASVRAPLSKHGIAIVQRPLESDGELIRLETLLTHKSGQWIGGELCMKPANSTPQGIGSALTYARRYSAASMLGIAIEEDDDGKAASKPQGPQRTKPVTHTSTLRVEIPVQTCDELDRHRIIRAAKDLDWDVAKLTETIGQINRLKLNDLTKEEATSLAVALEKKFLKQQTKGTF